jgi:hypothetical protein
MPFIGNQPALSYTSFAKQDFTTSATTSYTLDNPVTNENELALFINFVRQEPTTAYTATNTSLTLTSATSASDDMYCVYLGKAIQTVNPPAGSVGASQISDGSIALGKLSATGTKDATTFLRGDNTFASAGGANTPNFSAVNSGSQTISHDTLTKCSITTETYDSDSAYDAANSKFVVPSGEGGKYHLVASINWDVTVNPNVIRFFKNGSEILATTWGATAQSYIVGTLNLSASDYIEVYCYQASGGSTGWGSANRVYFSGFKIIE